jgi:hypothetical protein
LPTISFGPVSVSAAGPIGSTNGIRPFFDTGQTGSALSSAALAISAVAVVGYTGSAWNFACLWYDSIDGLLQRDDIGTQHFNTSSSGSMTLTAPAGAERAVVEFEAALNTPDTATAVGNGSFGTTTYCSYGTQVKASTPDWITLVPDILVIIAGAVTDGWAWPIAALFLGRTLDLKALCMSPRPAPPVFSPSELLSINRFPPDTESIAAIAKAWQWLHWAAWPQFCECVPGSPSPLPPPVVIEPPPTGAPPGPLVGFTCDTDELCTQMQRLTLAVSALAQGQASMSSLVTLIQRQHVPFAYVPGTRHSGLSGSGTLAISSLLGVSVEATTIPTWLSATTAPVNSYFRLGEISLGTAEGWQRRIIVTHSQHLVLDLDGDLTTLGYLFEPGVVANILELVREP